MIDLRSRSIPASLVLLSLGCASTTITTTVLPPHRLEAPVCPLAVLVHDSPNEIPPGGRILARLRLEGGDMRMTSEKIRRRLRDEAGKLGANRVLAAEVTTPSTLAALGMTIATSVGAQEREQIRREALENPRTAPQATVPPPSDPSFYGKGIAYAIFLPDDTLRTKLECPAG